MSKVLAFILVGVFSFSAFASSAIAAGASEVDPSYSKYIHLMHDKQYEQAFDLIVSRRKTDGWAQGNFDDWLAALNPQKNAPPEMTKLAQDWLDKSAREGDANDQYLWAMINMNGYFRGDQPRERFIEVIALLNKLVDQKNQFAIYTLSGMSKKAIESLGADSRYAGKP